MEPVPTPFTRSEASLQLLLFVDKRPSSDEKIRQIRNRFTELRADYDFDLQIIDVGDQPHLAEHFKLIATPTLIKVYPEPRQTLAGSDLSAQIENWWPRWRQASEEYDASAQSRVGNLRALPTPSLNDSLSRSDELIQLSDDVFRLKQEKEELQEQLDFKDRLISMLAHDLRNPLTAVSIALETLAMGNEKQETYGESRLTPAIITQLLKHARTQAKAIDRMITDLLQAARSSDGRLQLQPQKMDLGELCLAVVDSLKEQFQAKAQTVVTDIPIDLPIVYADLERVRQVLINLLDNAIKYTPAAGKVEVAILHRTAQKVQISISDTGPGIPGDNQEQIFDDSFRLERDAEKAGYGIGLAVCQRIVRAHYGQIWVNSELGHGSCFHFTLPVYRP